jgi:hypothetical protein
MHVGLSNMHAKFAMMLTCDFFEHACLECNMFKKTHVNMPLFLMQPRCGLGLVCPSRTSEQTVTKMGLPRET